MDAGMNFSDIIAIIIGCGLISATFLVPLVSDLLEQWRSKTSPEDSSATVTVEEVRKHIPPEDYFWCSY